MSGHYQARRRFLKRSLAHAVAGSGALAMTGKLNLVGSALAGSSSYAGISDYRPLIRLTCCLPVMAWSASTRIYRVFGRSMKTAMRQYWPMPVSVNSQYGPKLLDYQDVNKYPSNAGRDSAMAQILALDNEHMLKQFAGDSHTRARDSSRLLTTVMAQHSASTRDFTTRGNLGEQLKMVARLIAGRDIMGQQRQIFFVGMGGWDIHDAQSLRMNQLTGDLDKGLSSFQQELAALGVGQNVTTFTASDFGRTLTVNGDGSDHGWGGHYLVMGGAVDGGKMVGNWPSYVIDGNDDTGDKGRMIPSISVNQYGAALASWMGLSNSDIATVFPDLANFDDSWVDYGLFT